MSYYKPSRELLNEHWEAIKAFKDGKVIQVATRTDQKFEDYSGTDPAFMNSNLLWRIKPTPTLRPWRPEEVPVGALLRHRTVTFVRSPVTLILSVRGAWIGFVCAETFKLTDMLCENINKSYEHSLDHGKTWLPCGVAE